MNTVIRDRGQVGCIVQRGLSLLWHVIRRCNLSCLSDDRGGIENADVRRYLRIAVCFLSFVVAALFGYNGSNAQDSPVEPSDTLIVGVKLAAPFAMGAGGVWKGISIELWEEIASDLGWTFKYQEFGAGSPDDLIAATRNRRVDLAVAALTVTPDRERTSDFSHPFYSTGLGLAVASNQTASWRRAISRLLSGDFLGTVAGLFLLLLAVGISVWAFERRQNPEEFGGNTLRGIGSGLWWSAATMTSVGYGDKLPRTLGGRSIALVWMFAGIIMISTFTATITSSLTLTHLQSVIRGPQELPTARVGTVLESAPAASLDSLGISFRHYTSIDEALRAVLDDEIEVAVYDEPLLSYRVRKNFQSEIEVLARTFEQQDYAIMFPENSPLRELVNRSLLKIIRQKWWQDVLRKYLGE